MAVPPVARSTPPTQKVELTAEPRPETAAVICLLVPASLHSTLVKVAVPLPPEDPILRAVVPSSEPNPEVKVRIALAFAARPTELALPNVSWTLTTGCVTSGEP